MSELAIAAPELGPDYLFSFSQINLWDRCSFAWSLSYQHGWTKSEKKRALEFGSFMHELLAIYYDDSKSPVDIEDHIKSYFFEPDKVTANTLQVVDHGSWLYDRYLEWAELADRDQYTLAVEYHFEMDMVTPKGIPFKLQGYIDHIFEEMKKVWLRDHKTYNSTPITPIEAIMDPQMPVYAIAMREHGFTPFGIEFNQLNSYQYKKRDEVTPDKLFRRERTYRTTEELDAVAVEVGRLVDDIYANHSNVRRSLKRDCRMCDYQEPCLMNLKGIPLEDSFAMGDWRKKESFSG